MDGEHVGCFITGLQEYLDPLFTDIERLLADVRGLAAQEGGAA